jgi:CBS domain-containing protein
MKVEELMTREVETVSPETSLKEVAALLGRRGISGVPVVDSEGHVLGVVSEGDILRKEQGLASEHSGLLGWLTGRGDADERLEAQTAAEAMTAPALSIAPWQAAHEAARAMVERQINRLPVVEGDRLVGIVTRADLVRAFARTDDEIHREIEEDVLVHTLWLDPSRVSVSVKKGVVALAGEAETRTEAELLEAFVRRVPGVVDVTSEVSWAVDDLARRTSSARMPRRL